MFQFMSTIFSDHNMPGLKPNAKDRLLQGSTVCT